MQFHLSVILIETRMADVDYLLATVSQLRMNLLAKA
jgi:hypothetical protein